MENTNNDVWISPEWERRHKIKEEERAKWEENDIETSTIFDGLGDNWKNYDRDFLWNKVKPAIENMHRQKNIMTHFNDGSHYNKIKLNNFEDIYRQYDEFPLPIEYRAGEYKDDIYTIRMDEICIVTREYQEFYILFAVQYSLTPINKCNDFLKHQLKKSFAGDLNEFKEFMDNICLEYKEFLADKYEPFYKDFLTKLEPSTKDKETAMPVKQTVKLKWLGTPSQFAYVFLELSKNGFIEIPSTSGEASYSRYAKVSWELFEFNKTTQENLQKEMNPNKNTLSDTVKAKFTFPSLDEISKKQKK